MSLTVEIRIFDIEKVPASARKSIARQAFVGLGTGFNAKMVPNHC